MDYVSLLRQMMYKRLSPSVITFRHGDIISFPGFRAGTTLPNISMEVAFGGVPVMINHDTVAADCNVVGRFDATGEQDESDGWQCEVSGFDGNITVDSEDPSESASVRISLTQEDISQIRDMVAGEDANGVIIYPENANPDFRALATANSGTTPDISEAVAKGEIKSTGNSVSVDDVIARIDAELEANKDDDHP